jgi:hypothetical protein
MAKKQTVLNGVRYAICSKVVERYIESIADLTLGCTMDPKALRAKLPKFLQL